MDIAKDKVKKVKFSETTASAFTWKKLSKFMVITIETAKQHPFVALVALFVTITNGFLSILMPLFSSKVVEAITNNTNSAALNIAGVSLNYSKNTWLIILGVTFIIFLFTEYISNVSTIIFANRIETMQRVKILKSLVEQEVDFFFDNVSGNILTRLVSDTQGVALGTQQFTSAIVYFASSITFSIAILFLEGQWFIATIAISCSIIINIVSVLLFVWMRRKLIYSFDIKREIDAYLTDRVNNISLIKSSGKEKEEIEEIRKKNHKYELGLNTANYINAGLNSWMLFGSQLITPLIMIIICIQEINGDVNAIQKALVTISMVGEMSALISMLAPTLRMATQSSNCSSRIAQLTDPKPTIYPNENGKEIEEINEIEFKNLSFAYPKEKNKVVLPNLDITFEKNKSYAFVGESGAGKSTIAKLLLRFYEPTKGKIIINKKYDLKKINLPAYLDRIGYVEQEPQILFGNFFENIKYSKFDATDEEVIEACKKANLHKFIESLPDGYNTTLGQRGFILSGGQKQRLVIARVFLKNPDLIILDEATSALDNIVEKEIQSELDKLIKGRTCVTIAHRLSTIKNVDVIYVLGSNGEGIIQTGKFDDLIKEEGHFKKLYELSLD